LLFFRNMYYNMKYLILLFTGIIFVACATKSQNKEESKKQESFVELQNPVIPGYFADPSIVQHEGKFYMYVTADPWGTEFLSCWESEDFQNWTFHKLNWPTKEACTSLLSNTNNVWAPSVIKKEDTFYMYISVGSEIWCGKADHPLGPWRNMHVDQPMIPYDTTRYYHVIDAEAFIDDDGRAYLYWGSGWEWINGRCFAAELNEDMKSFKTEPVEVTPTNYFEGPLMLKHNGKYYLTYSEGKTIDETYEVRYAIGDSPLGPFIEATNGPILKTDESLNVYGPGHHTIFTYGEKKYILYHRHSLPFVTGTAMRQTCIAVLEFDDITSKIRNLTPYHTQLFPNLAKKEIKYIIPENIIASSEQSFTKAKNVLDKNYATRWEAASGDERSFLMVSFKNEVSVDTMEIRFEYPWKTYFFKLEVSSDEDKWVTAADYAETGVSGSPVIITINNKCKQLRISFDDRNDENTPSIWELSFY
jgi:Beta-xylosidase